ncbi:MAG: glycosyltransferase family 2 protein [Candidatus Nanoarchaeia archaeon]|jgi:glycosyltransferase involved in cell wall biosynthesis
MKLSIVIPAFNEASNIIKTIKETLRTVSSFQEDFEVIVVDDGSTDATAKVARSVNDKRLRVVKKRNGGKGSALKYGFKFVKGDFVTFIDADLDLHPRQIKCFLEVQQVTSADIVVGNKRHPESKIVYPWHRRFLSQCFYYFQKMLFGLPVKDTQAGLKLFRKEVLERVFAKSLVKRYAADLEFLVNANQLGYKIADAPVEICFQRFNSRIKLSDIYYMFMDMLGIFYRLRIKHYYDT